MVIVNATTDLFKDVFTTGYWTGMRKGEILNLTWDKVNLMAGILTLEPEDTKEGNPKTIPVGKAVHCAITKGGKISGGVGHVFTYFGRPVSFVHTAARASHDKAGLKYGRKVEGWFIFHDLRRTFITDMRKAGVERTVIMSITGHADRDMHDRYNQVDDGDKLEAIRILEAYREKIRQTLDKTPTQIKKPLINKGLGSR